MSALNCVTRGLFLKSYLCKVIKISSIRGKATSSGAYFILLPEIPPGNPETNPLLRKDDLIQFANITPGKCMSAIGRHTIEYETGIRRLEEKLIDGSIPKTFETVVDPLEKLEEPFTTACCVLNCLCIVRTDIPEYIKLYHKLSSGISITNVKKYDSLPIYHAIKELDADRNHLTEFQKRVVDKHLLESRLNGMELSGSDFEAYCEILRIIKKEQEKFRKNMNISSSRFKHTISHENLMRRFPDELVMLMANDRTRPRDGPWTITLDPHIYRPFLEYCSDRMTRWNIWRALINVASHVTDEYNSLPIEEIRHNRHDLATLLGFETYADMAMKTKMLGSVEKVQAMISDLHAKTKPVLEKELLELQEFALNNDFNHKLELWDVPYWSRQQKEFLYSVDKYEVSQYFPLETVLKGLFEFCRSLFGISIEEMEISDEFKCDRSVRLFKILNENGEDVAKFYFDPYSSPKRKYYGATRTEPLRYKIDLTKTQPMCYLWLNVRPPVLKQPALLTFKEVTDLFKKFGMVLQHSLTTSPYCSVSGSVNLEWDVLEVVPHFMSHWLDHYETARDVSGHVETGEKLPLDLHEKLVKRQKHMFAFSLNNELYRSALDLELYRGKKDFWMKIMERIWPEYVPFPLVRNDGHPCSFSEIFVGPYAASYFSFTWSRVVAADVFSSFREAGLNNKEHAKELGRRFRDTYLALGGGCHSSEVFRRFRGRDPSTDALLVAYGTKKLSTDGERGKSK